MQILLLVLGKVKVVCNKALFSVSGSGGVWLPSLIFGWLLYYFQLYSLCEVI